jgi:hypothetical protein
MRTAIPTEMWLRLAKATPEQYATVERVLGMSPSEPESVSPGAAFELFALLKALESETNYRKAPITRVFLLYCRDSLTLEQVAKACRCSPSLIKLRFREIEKKLGRKPSELRTFSGEFERIADSLSDSRARRIDRGRAIQGGDPDEDQ